MPRSIVINDLDESMKETTLTLLRNFLDRHDLTLDGCGCVGCPHIIHNNVRGEVDWEEDEFTHDSHSLERDDKGRLVRARQ